MTFIYQNASLLGFCSSDASLQLASLGFICHLCLSFTLHVLVIINNMTSAAIIYLSHWNYRGVPWDHTGMEMLSETSRTQGECLKWENWVNSCLVFGNCQTGDFSFNCLQKRSQQCHKLWQLWPVIKSQKLKQFFFIKFCRDWIMWAVIFILIL